MRRRKDPFLPKDRIDDKAQDALDALDRIKKKGLSKELRANIVKVKNDLHDILRDNHHQA